MRSPSLYVVAIVMGLVMSAAGCAPSGPPVVKVVTYVRNATTEDGTVIARPVASPPVIVQFHASDMGVACSDVPGGSQLSWARGEPNPADPTGEQLVALIGSQDSGAPRLIWIDVAANGAVTTGTGEPAWWDSGPAGC
jgi:hypothetical protein